jgi:hypothetical protein
VPVHDLPLQAVLEFKPCPTDAAVSYLQNLCSAEGYFVESDNLSQLYTRTAPNEALQSAPDLRRTIHALQVICLKETKSNEVPSGTAKTSLGGIEFLSYMDSYLMEDSCRMFAVRVHLFRRFPCAYKDRLKSLPAMYRRTMMRLDTGYCMTRMRRTRP